MSLNRKLLKPIKVLNNQRGDYMTGLTKEEILYLQNNLYKLYIRFKKIKKKNDFNLNDIKRVVDFYRRYVMDNDNPYYDDKDFTNFCNIEDDQFEPWVAIKYFTKEEVEKMDKKYHELDKQLVFKSMENISKKYFIFKYLIRLDVNGLVKTGNFKNNDILISNRDNKYIIKLKDKDNNQEQQQFTFNSEKEVEDFFRENDMIIKWENMEEQNDIIY